MSMMQHAKLLLELMRFSGGDSIIIRLHPSTLPVLRKVCGDYPNRQEEPPPDWPVSWSLMGHPLELSDDVALGTVEVSKLSALSSIGISLLT